MTKVNETRIRVYAVLVLAGVLGLVALISTTLTKCVQEGYQDDGGYHAGRPK